MATPEVIQKVTGAPVGFAGPQGLHGVKIYADHTIKTIAAGITGANKKDYHVKNVVLNRDFRVDEWGDFRFVENGDSCLNARRERCPSVSASKSVTFSFWARNTARHSTPGIQMKKANAN
jgi:prolyl-tRNA synthetase